MTIICRFCGHREPHLGAMYGHWALTHEFRRRTVLGLKTIKADRTSHNGFTWPTVGGTATAPDWDGKPICGGGLHFLPWGEGNGSLLNWSSSALWLVVDDGDSPDTVLFEGKAKARSLTVAFEGTRRQATDYLVARAPRGKAIVGATVIVGDKGTATAGYRGTATAGAGGTAMAGAGGTAMAGYRGTAMAGNWGTATAGYRGTATAGAGGTATAGAGGTATAGAGGTATAGNWGTAMAGNWGTAMAGAGGTATAGNWGVIIMAWWDRVAKRRRLATGYIGEGGLKSGVPYKADGEGRFIEA